MASDIVDYTLIGDDLQAVIITLDPGEAVVAEAGAMMYMEEGITMATTLDPNASGGGLFDKLIGAGKRVLSGDGPCNKERLAHRQKSEAEGAWVREAALAFAAKRRQRVQAAPVAAE